MVSFPGYANYTTFKGCNTQNSLSNVGSQISLGGRDTKKNNSRKANRFWPLNIDYSRELQAEFSGFNDLGDLLVSFVFLERGCVYIYLYIYICQ